MLKDRFVFGGFHVSSEEISLFFACGLKTKVHVAWPLRHGRTICGWWRPGILVLIFITCKLRVIIRPERAQVQVITPHGPSILRMGIISTANLPRSMKADPEPLDRTSMLTSSLPPSPPSTMVCITRPGGRMKTWGQGRDPDTRRIG